MKISRSAAYLLGVGTGAVLCLLFTYTGTGTAATPAAGRAPAERSMKSVIWIPDVEIDEQAIHSAMGRPISDVLALAGIQDQAAIGALPERRVDAETFDHGWMKVECERLYAAKCRDDGFIVFGEVFGHMPGYTKVPASPFFDGARNQR